MASEELSSSAIACAEHIAFLYQLHTVPSSPSKNKLNYAISHRENYVLPLDLEDKLSDVLAFLAGVKNDSLHIPGIAILERNQSSKLEVLLAVNMEKYGDGEVVLQKTKSRLEDIFNVLAQVSDHVSQFSTRQAKAEMKPSYESLVFAKIVTMCADRILCRLRLAPNHYKKPKQPLKSVLNEAIIAMEQLKANKGAINIAFIDLFIIKAKVVTRQIDVWQKHHDFFKLEAIVDAVYDLRQTNELPTLLNMITNKMMGPSSRKNLSNTISKVARYREAARFLYRKAKKHALVRNMSVILVKLPREAFNRTTTLHCTQSLASAIPRYIQSRKPRSIASIYQLLGDNTNKANEKFLKQTMKTIKEAKIHAEIQIFAYCQLNAIQPPPRVICSSKDACFLCSSFMGLQTKVYVPRSHGRLYPGWRLPLLAQFNDLQNVFNEHLQQIICNSIKSKLSMAKRVLYPDPIESTTFTLTLSNTTVCSAPATNVYHASNFSTQSPSKGNSTESISETSTTASKIISTSTSQSFQSNTDNGVSISSEKPLISRYATSSNLPSHDNPVIIKGKRFSALVQLDATPLIFRHQSFELHVEYSGEDWQLRNCNESKYALVTAEWFASEEIENLHEIWKENTVDSRLLDTKVEHVLKDSECFYLRVMESLIRISIQHVGDASSTSVVKMPQVISTSEKKEEIDI